MRKNQDRHALRKCAEMRALQVMAAEAQAARAELQLLRQQRELEQRRDELEQVLQYWEQAVSRPVLKLETMPLWRTAVVHHEERFETAHGAAERASSLRDKASAGVHVAQQRKDVADRLAARAVAKHRQHLEETEVNDAGDRHLQYGRDI
jgi:cell division septum initiation protein DivIVA